MAAEYDFDYRKAKRNRYAERFKAGSLVVMLEPDVARLFPDAKSVNRALRACGELVSAVSARKKKAS